MTLSVAANPSYITEEWKSDIKGVLEDTLMLRSDVSWWQGEFPKGDILHVPTMGQLTTRDYEEGATIKTESVSSTDFQLTITEYKQTGIQITDKFRDDSVYVDNLINKYKVEIVAAINRELESNIAHLQAEQTASNPNVIDSVDHRFVSTATGNTGGLKDFQLALLALNKSRAMSASANAYISPEYLFELQQVANLAHQHVYGQQQLIKEGGLVGKMITAASETKMLVGTIACFNVYQNLYLDNEVAETITATHSKFATGTTTAASANLFVGREAFVGAMRTMPEVEEFRDHKTKSDIVHGTFRYGIKTYRPESVVVALTQD